MYIYIYIEREREREIERDIDIYTHTLYIYIYIYIYNRDNIRHAGGVAGHRHGVPLGGDQGEHGHRLAHLKRPED